MAASESCAGRSTRVARRVFATAALLSLGLAPAFVICQDTAEFVGNAPCAKCHADIFNSYQKTSMAHSSGMAAERFMAADFTHKPSGAHYRIYEEDGTVWLSFDRPGDAAVRGKRELLYYIGSGRRGRTYLFATDGFLFESPVNWYADRQVWDAAPAYGNASHIPMDLPAFPSCLQCHVSGVQPLIHGTENRYPNPPFLHSGVSCERCHGAGAAHLKGGAIVNPAKLEPVRRDEVCMQCHMEGKAAIERAGSQLRDFRPGQPLANYIRYFVFADEENLGAVSQFEALAQSACKKKSGDAMSCTSCHDPHYEPAASEKANYYRQKCVACHGEKFASTHHANQPDCTGCHMPSSASVDVAHTEVTDHRIPRRQATSPESLRTAGTEGALPKLAPFPKSQSVDPRDLALAWVSLVNKGMSDAAPLAEEYVRAALKQSPDDPALLSARAYELQVRGDLNHAREYYAKALSLDPTLIDAATNLGIAEAKEGHVRDAARLWDDAFRRAPAQSVIGIDLARVFCASAQTDRARDYVMRVLEFNPDLPEAKTLLRNLNGDSAKCE